MTISLTTANDPDALVLLFRWLSEDDEFRGRVRRAPGRVEPGAMGAIADALIVQAGPAIAGLTTVLVAWLRRRGGTVEIEAAKADGGKVRIRAEDVRGLDTEGLRALSTDLAKRLAESPGPTSTPEMEGPATQG